MAKVVVKSKVKKVKKKFPVEIKAPEYLNSVNLGNTQTTDLKTFIGKKVKMNMMYVTNNMKNQNVRLVFKIIEVNSGLANTIVSKYEQIPYYLGRNVKKGSDLVEDSFIVKSKDGVEIRTKPFLITKQNVGKNVLSALRLKTREVIKNDLIDKTYEEFISAVISGKLQNVYRNEIKNIFPLKSFEFKKVEIN